MSVGAYVCVHVDVDVHVTCFYHVYMYSLLVTAGVGSESLHSLGE